MWVVVATRSVMRRNIFIVPAQIFCETLPRKFVWLSWFWKKEVPRVVSLKIHWSILCTPSFTTAFSRIRRNYRTIHINTALDMKFCGRVIGSFNYVFSVQTRILWFDLRMSNIGLIYRPISMRPFGGWLSLLWSASPKWLQAIDWDGEIYSQRKSYVACANFVVTWAPMIWLSLLIRDLMGRGDERKTEPLRIWFVRQEFCHRIFFSLMMRVLEHAKCQIFCDEMLSFLSQCAFDKSHCFKYS